LQNAEFEQYKKAKLTEIARTWQDKNYKDSPVLQGFRDLHTKVGRSNRDFIASPESLLGRFVKKGVFPQVNTIVDIYNLVSLKSQLALGAHDIEYVKGNLTLRLTDGSENFIPLGTAEPEKVFPGEYAYVDDKNNVVCRLEVLQVEPTKITLNSNDIFFIIQGNQNTEQSYILNYATQLGELVAQYCGGDFSILL
jgi:DNA/RNA-binding domain of Phe-tRNA-synthetase-like protein